MGRGQSARCGGPGPSPFDQMICGGLATHTGGGRGRDLIRERRRRRLAVQRGVPEGDLLGVGELDVFGQAICVEPSGGGATGRLEKVAEIEAFGERRREGILHSLRWLGTVLEVVFAQRLQCFCTEAVVNLPG